MRLSPKQKEFWNEPFHRWNIKHGATRSGKTYLDYFMIPRRIRERKGKDGLIVLIGNTKGTLQRNVIEPMQEIYGGVLVSSIRSDNTAYIFGERVHCLGADNKKHVDRLRGSSIKYCYGDEVVTWAHDVFEMLKSRLDKPYSCFDGTCNPGGPNHWFKQFIDSSADIFAQHYTIDDNPFLDERVREEIKREYAGVFYRRYILGLWAVAEGAVYPGFDPDRHVSDKVSEVVMRWVGVDYGHSNPTVFLLLGSCVDGRVWVLKEYYHKGADGQRSPRQLSRDLTDFSEGIELDRELIDPSAEGFINQRREDGALCVRQADNRVLPGIQLLSGLIDADMLRVTPDCPHTIAEFQGYVWDDKAQAGGVDKPRKQDDHCMDALRYGVMGYERELQRRMRNAGREMAAD